MKTRRRGLEIEYLETRALLSGSPGHIGTHFHHDVVMAGSGPGASPAQQVGTGGSFTGGGLLSVPTAPGSADVTAMQDATSDNNLVLFLTQFEALSGSNAASQQTALSILNDARNVDLALNAFAGGVAVTLPGNIAGNGQVLALQMISAVRAGSADQTFSSLIVQAETTEVAQFEQMATGAEDASIRTFAAGLLPTVQADLAAAQGTSALAPVSSTPSSSTLSSTDLNTLETYYSINLMERFLGQLTLFVTTRNPIDMYSAKLIGDHEQGVVGLGAYAAATQTYLPAALTASDAPMATTIIAALRSARPRNSTRYDRVYLKQMIMGHTAALKLTANVIATAQNPVLKQFAIDVQPTIFIHLLAAKTLLRSLG